MKAIFRILCGNQPKQFVLYPVNRDSFGNNHLASLARLFKKAKAGHGTKYLRPLRIKEVQGKAALSRLPHPNESHGGHRKCDPIRAFKPKYAREKLRLLAEVFLQLSVRLD